MRGGGLSGLGDEIFALTRRFRLRAVRHPPVLQPFFVQKRDVFSTLADMSFTMVVLGL